MSTYDLSNLPEPLPADEPAKATATPQEIPTVNNPVSSLPQPVPADEPRGLMADLAVGAARGAESAVRGLRETARTVEKAIVPERFQDAGLNDELTYGSDAPEGTLGKITADVTRFSLGFLGAGAAIKGAGLVAGAAKSALSTAVTSDPTAERLSNLIEAHPFLSNPITEYLATDKNDSVAESKFKAGLEDLGLSAIGGVLFKTLKLAKESLSPSVAKSGAESVAAALKVPAPVVAPTIQETKVVAMADSVGLNLTPEHSSKLAGALDEIMGHTYQGADVAGAAADRGMLNVSKMQTSEEVKATINRFGEVLAPAMKAAGWTERQTHVETVYLAEQLGLEPDVLVGSLRNLGHDAGSIPQTLVAGRMLLQSQTADLFSAARRATITGEGKDEAIKSLSRVADTLANIKMITTGASRTTESGKLPVGEINPERLAAWITKQGGHDNVLQKIAMTEGDPTALAKLARSTDEIVQDSLDSALKVHNTIWINGLLSSPKTQIINTASTALNTLVQPLNLMVGGTMRRDWADVREGVAIYKGLGTFLGDSWQMAKKSLMTETQILGGNKILEPSTAMLDSQATWAQTLRFPTRLLGASDEFFKQLSYRAKMSAQAAREGMDAVKVGKITQDGLDNFIAEKFAGAFNKDGAALNEQALKYAEQATFTQSLDRATWLGNWAEGISSLSSHPALRGSVLPFVRVPSNLIRQVIDYTPVIGQLRKKFLVDVTAGGSQRSEALGRMAVGTGLWVGAGFLAMNDKITGAAPKDPELAAQLKATGWQPYSYVITNDDGTKSYASFNRLDPFASFLGLSADFHQIMSHLPEKKADDWAAIATLSLSNNLISKTYLKGILDTMTAISGNDPHRAATWIRQRVASYVPAITGVIQPDTEQKELRSWLDGAMAKIPGLSATVEAKRDPVTGQKMQAASGWSQSWNPFTMTKGNSDPVTAELGRLAQTDAQSQFSGPSEHLGNVDLTQFKSRDGQTAFDRLSELTGRGVGGALSLHDALYNKMNTASYKSGSDGDSYYTSASRINQLRMVQNEYKDRALSQVQREYPGLREAMQADKQNVQAVKHGKAPRNAMSAILDLNK